MLKSYQTQKQPEPKSAAKAKVAPSSKRVAARPAAAKASLKTSIGSVDSVKRRRTGPAPEACMTPLGPISSEDMSPADKEVAEAFKARLQELRIVKPPLSEPLFKSSLGDLISKCTTFCNDAKTKRRSVQRRSNKDDALSAALDDMESAIKEHITLLKCTWDCE